MSNQEAGNIPAAAIPSPSPPPQTLKTRWGQVAREFEWLCRLIVGGIFIWSGAAHLANPYYLLSTVYQYELTSAPLGAMVASYLPFFELLLATCLLSNACPRPVWLVTAVLLLTFVAVQISARSRGLNISCGCFSPEISRPIDVVSISFTAGLSVLAISAAVVVRRLRPLVPSA